MCIHTHTHLYVAVLHVRILLQHKLGHAAREVRRRPLAPAVAVSRDELLHHLQRGPLAGQHQQSGRIHHALTRVGTTCWEHGVSQSAH